MVDSGTIEIHHVGNLVAKTKRSEIARMPKGEFPHALYYQIFGLKPGKGESRKRQIVEAFIECLAKGGLEKTSYEVVAKKVGMKRTHVAYYFENREEMIRATIRYAIAVGQQMIILRAEKAKTMKEKFKVVVEGNFYWLETHPQFVPVLTLFYHLSSCDPSYRTLQTEIRNMGEQRIMTCLSFVPGMNETIAREKARMIQSLISGALHLYFCSDYPLSFAKLRELTSKTARDLLDT